MERESKRKISVYLTAENAEKMDEFIRLSGLTQTEFINKCCSQTNIIILGQSNEVAKAFVELANAINLSNDEAIKRGEEKLCQFLELLQEKTIA